MIETVIRSSVLIIVIAAVRAVFADSLSPKLRYALWALAALRLLLPFPLIRSDVSVLGAVNVPEIKRAASETYISEPEEADGILYADMIYDEEPEKPMSVGELLTRIRSAGTGVCLAWLALVNIVFYVQLRRRRVIVNAESERWLYEAGDMASPCLYGILQPTVYLTPKCLTDGDTMRCVIAHEETHYRHGDHIWSLLRAVLVCIYWFNPLVWMAAVMSSHDGELACDFDAVKRLGEDKRELYGTSIIKLSSRRGNPAQLLCAGTRMTKSKSLIKRRIRFIAGAKKQVKYAAAVTAAVLAAAAAVTFTSAKYVPLPAYTEPPTVISTFDTSFGDWDVTFTLRGEYRQRSDGMYEVSMLLDNTDNRTGARRDCSGLAKIGADEYMHDLLQMTERKDTGEGILLTAESERPIRKFYIQTPWLLKDRDEWVILTTSEELGYDVAQGSRTSAGMVVHIDMPAGSGLLGSTLVTHNGTIAKEGSRMTSSDGSAAVDYFIRGLSDINDGFYLAKRGTVIRLDPLIQQISTGIDESDPGAEGTPRIGERTWS